MATDVSKQVRSFVAFALAMKPDLVLRRKADASGPHLLLQVSVHDRLSEHEISSLEHLLEKYKPLKSYLDAILNAHEEIATCRPTVNFQPNVHHKLVRLTSEQFAVAGEVAHRAEHVHGLHTAGDHARAAAAYKEFHSYLAQQRTTLAGELKNVEFSDAVGSYGVGRVADDDCSGAVIFVIIEIFICFQAEPQIEAERGGAAART